MTLHRQKLKPYSASKQEQAILKNRGNTQNGDFQNGGGKRPAASSNRMKSHSLSLHIYSYQTGIALMNTLRAKSSVNRCIRANWAQTNCPHKGETRDNHQGLPSTGHLHPAT